MNFAPDFDTIHMDGGSFGGSQNLQLIEKHDPLASKPDIPVLKEGDEMTRKTNQRFIRSVSIVPGPGTGCELLKLENTDGGTESISPTEAEPVTYPEHVTVNRLNHTQTDSAKNRLYQRFEKGHYRRKIPLGLVVDFLA